jgi:chromosome segregation ATPase
MSSEISEASADLGQDPQMRCLALAEKIISSLNDPELVQRYFNLKAKLFAGRPESPPVSPSQSEEIPTDRAYAFYQSLAQENQKLREEIATLSARKPDFSDAPENESLAAKLRDLQRRILPTHNLPPKGDAVQELDSLRKVVDAKIESLNFIREKLRAQNQQLTNDYREIEQQSNLRIASAREKEETERQAIEAQQNELSAQYSQAQRDLEEATEQLQAAAEENARLRQKHSDTAALLESIEAEYQETERQIEQMESESEALVETIEQLRTDVSRKTKELNALQTLQKYRVDVAGDFEIADEIQRLSQRAEELRAENTQMTFELKRLERRQQTGSLLTTPEAISLDEDELAAQILRSKWH